ncbi:MurR/RpiR family transcriptional regulator [Prosthecodimorpha staleyi]|uniref:MurR/RpiR family transcriptional regulator n=1 Tax=Prosthecodimorpha staleyi TaxID=2840188 RepID=A0A947GFS1_9HYPH|nr:MurR/RpiR family transcriptional regulator [Prosthecodimorpha staleyi]MBT9290930.1 MurR/RpiR family transcriptional regulator [Prosthecodimorpha staleyi]
MAEATLSQRILESYDDLTRQERRLADLLLENPDLLGLHSATEISGKANVSKATTARFFRRLGYASFKTAQKKAREGSNAPEPRSRPEKLERKVGRGQLADHLAGDVQNLVRTIETLRSDELNMAIHLLARAEKFWVVGFGDNYPLAHFARALLIRIKPDIRMIPIGGFSVPEEFASISPTDAMLALGVGRKTRNLRSIMRSAIRAGVQVIYLTDQAARGSAEVANVTLRCRTRGVSVYESVVAPVSLITYLCSAVALRIGEDAIERLHFIEHIHEEWGDLVPGDL